MFMSTRCVGNNGLAFSMMAIRLAAMLLCLAVLAGCATDEAVEPDSARIDLGIAASEFPSFITVFESDSLHWKIDAALLCAGEIGIHWSRKLAKAAAGAAVGESLVAARTSHDVPTGKPSPKVYEYHALDLLKGTPIQTLTVGPALYDHVHMIWKQADATLRGIDSLGALQSHALWITGSVQFGDSTRPFTLAIDTTYRENDLGDVLFDLEVRNGEAFALTLSAKLDSWFNDVLWADLKPTRGDTADITFANANRNAARKVERRYRLDNAFTIQVKKKS